MIEGRFLWPLVEARAVGTASVAFDTGAHPEVTPLLFSSLDELVPFIAQCSRERPLLRHHSTTAYRFVRGRFRWADTARAFDAVAVARTGALRHRAESWVERARSSTRIALHKTTRSLRDRGVRATGERVREKLEPYLSSLVVESSAREIAATRPAIRAGPRSE